MSQQLQTLLEHLYFKELKCDEEDHRITKLIQSLFVLMDELIKKIDDLDKRIDELDYEIWKMR